MTSADQAADPLPKKGSRRIRIWMILIAPAMIAALLSVHLALGAWRSLAGTRANFETSTCGAMYAYVEAQADYRETHRNAAGQPVYADQLDKLRGLLPDGMIAARGPGGQPYHGYLFREIKRFDNGKPIDPAHDFALCAIPVEYERTGYRTFIVSTNGLLMGADLGPNKDFVVAYPTGPFFTDPPWYIDTGEEDITVDPKTGKYHKDSQGRIIPRPKGGQ